jgi:hypothetical protein
MGSSLPDEPSWVNENHSASLFTASLVRAFERMLMPPDSSALQHVSFQQFHAYCLFLYKSVFQRHAH